MFGMKLKFVTLSGLVLFCCILVAAYEGSAYLDRLAIVKLDVAEECSDFDLYKFQMPLAKDREYVQSSMYGYVRAVLGEEGISEIDENNQLTSLIEKFKSGDVESLYESSVDKDVFQDKSSFVDFVELYNHSFGEYKGFAYKGAVCMGEKRVIYWQIKKENKDFVRYFIFSYKDGKYFLSDRNTNSDLVPLFLKVFSESKAAAFEIDYLLEDISEYHVNIFNHDGEGFAKLMIPDAVFVGKSVDLFASATPDDEMKKDVASFFNKILALKDPNNSGLFTKFSSDKFLRHIEAQEDVDMVRYKDIFSRQNLLYLVPAAPFILVGISNLEFTEIDSNESIQFLYLIETNGAYRQTSFYRRGYFDRVLKNNSDLYLLHKKLREKHENTNN